MRDVSVVTWYRTPLHVSGVSNGLHAHHTVLTPPHSPVLTFPIIVSLPLHHAFLSLFICAESATAIDLDRGVGADENHAPEQCSAT